MFWIKDIPFPLKAAAQRSKVKAMSTGGGLVKAQPCDHCPEPFAAWTVFTTQP